MSRRLPPAVAITVLIGAVLRFAPIGYGLPFIYHPDESILIVNLAKSLEGLSRGAATVGMSTFYYPLSVLYATYFAVGRLTGHFASLGEFKTAVLMDDPTLHLIGRGLSAAFSVAALVALYAVARRLYGRRGGLIAVVLMSVSLVDITSAQWLKFDSTVAFMSLLALLACFSVVDAPGRWRPACRAGVIIGLAAATRVDLVILIPVLVVASVLARKPASATEALGALLRGPLLAAVGVAAVVYALFSFQLVNVIARQFFAAQDVFTTRQLVPALLQFLSAGDLALTVRHNAAFYAWDVLVGIGGVAVALAVSIGAVRALAVRTHVEIVLLCFVALMAVSMLALNVYATHYFLPVTPPLVVLAAGGVLWVASRLERVSPYAWVLVLAVTAAQPAVYSLGYVRYVLTNHDTRTRAREWLLREVPADASMAVQKFDELPRYLPPLEENVDRIQTKLRITQQDGRGSGLGLEAQLAHPPSHGYAIINLSSESYWNGHLALENAYDLTQLRSAGVRYIVTSGYSNPPWESNEDGSPFGLVLAPRAVNRAGLEQYHAFMASLRRSSDVAAEFVARNPSTARRTDAPIDPTIRVYRLRPVS